MLRHRLALIALAAMALMVSFATDAQPVEPRIALVIGNGNYSKGPLPTALNDAGLVAEALRSIGFEIVEGADLSQADINTQFRDFLTKVEAAGPSAIAFVYFSGYGFEFEGDNFLVAADARLERDTDIPLDTVRLSDLLRPLAGSPAQAKIFVVDAARQLPFALQGANLAPGLGALEAAPGTLVAMSAAPGLVVADGQGPYNPYATAIAEMVRTPGLDLNDAFIRIRTRTHQLTEGAETPWHVSALTAPVMLVPPDPGAPPVVVQQQRPMRDAGPDDAYDLAIQQDTLQGYSDFLEYYPQSPYAPRIFAIIRARREALAWLRALEINTPQSYWTYLRRYPDGIYGYDAERRLRRLSAAFEPPPGFVPIDFAGVPPPLAGEPARFIRVLPPAPPPPPRLIGPRPAIFSHLAPPPPRSGPRALPNLTPLPGVSRIPPGVRRPFGSPPGPSGGPGSSPGAGPRFAPPSANIAPPGGSQPNFRRPPGLPNRLPPPSGFQPNGAPGSSGPAANVTPGANPGFNRRPPGPPAGNGPPAPGFNRPAIVNRPPPPVVNPPRPPAATVVNRPPPPVFNRPPPPPAAVNRPPPPVARVAPPPPRPAAAPPPAKPAPAKKCVIENGKPVCH